MNKCAIVGNVTRDPETRTVKDGITVCTFTVAVNKRHGAQAGKEEADFFRVTAWRGLAEVCGKYIQKGRKVAVTGTVGVSAYTNKEGQVRANLELVADDVEFLSPANNAVPTEKRDAQTGFVQVDDDDELPF